MNFGAILVAYFGRFLSAMFSSTVFIWICVWLGLLVYMRPLAGAVNEDDFNKENGWENKYNSKDSILINIPY